MENKRQMILESAYEVLIDEGIEGFSMSKIGNQAKIPKSLIFHYFKNKEHLIKELVEFILNRNDSQVREFTDPSNDLSREGFIKYIDLLFSIDFSQSRLISAYYACTYLGVRNEDIKRKLNDSVAFARKTYTANFNMFVEKGLIEEKNTDMAVDYILTTIAGITKIADMECGSESVNQDLIKLHKRIIYDLLGFK